MNAMRESSLALPALRWKLLVLVSLAWFGCSGARTLSDLPTEEVAGFYEAESGGQWFWPCAESDGEAWWVTFTDAAVAQRDASRFGERLASGERVFVRWRVSLGDRSAGAPPGPGPGARYALVREILDVRRSEAGTCGPDETRSTG